MHCATAEKDRADNHYKNKDCTAYTKCLSGNPSVAVKIAAVRGIAACGGE